MTIAGDLPAYMRTGRGQSSGPVTGAYLSYSWVIDDVGASVTGHPGDVLAIKMPAGFRVEEIQWRALTVTGSTVTIGFYRDPTDDDSTSGATLMHTTAGSPAVIDLDANITGQIRKTGTTDLLTEAQRNFDQDDWFIVNVVTGAGEAIADLSIALLGYHYQHFNTDPADD